MTSFEEKRRAALAKAQTMAKPKSASDKESDTPVAPARIQSEEPVIEGNPLIKISKFNCRPIFSKVDISCEKWLLTMNEESREKLQKPPSLEDGIDFQTEQELRFLGCELIQEGAILLKLPQTAAATGQILFHRFYYQKSMLKYWIQHTVMACLLLASKIEEAPRRPRDIYNVFHRLEQLHTLKSKGKPITKETTAHMKPAEVNQKYMNAKVHVLNTEKRILSSLGFVVHVKHPHKLIISYIYSLCLGDRHDFIQKAWSYMNDGLRTDMFVRYTPETIACACIFLAARTVENPIPLPKEPFNWYELFDASDRDVQRIAEQLLGLYNRPKCVNMWRLLGIIDKLREEREQAEKIRQAELIAAKLTENNGKETRENSEKPRKRSRTRSRSRSPRRKHSPKKRRDSRERKDKNGGRDRDRRDDRRRDRDDRRRRSRSRDRRDRDRDYDKKDRKMRNDTIYETLKSRKSDSYKVRK